MIGKSKLCFWISGLMGIAVLLLTSGCESWKWGKESLGEDPFDKDVSLIRPIGVNDRIGITIMTTQRSESLEGVVDEHGMISLLHVGYYKVSGMKASELAVAITGEYKRRDIYIDPVITVINLSQETPAGQEYFLTGEVRQRGKASLSPGITLLQAIISAGDVTDFASSRVTITRRGKTKTFDLNAIRRGAAPDPIIHDKDVIVVKRAVI